MSHDPLCPCWGNPPWFTTCQCDLITKVREDISGKIYDYGEKTHEPHSARYACQRCDITAAYRHASKIAKGHW